MTILHCLIFDSEFMQDREVVFMGLSQILKFEWNLGKCLSNFADFGQSFPLALLTNRGFPGGISGKELPANAGDTRDTEPI